MAEICESGAKALLSAVSQHKEAVQKRLPREAKPHGFEREQHSSG
jgi:hypothetical protein